MSVRQGKAPYKEQQFTVEIEGTIQPDDVHEAGQVSPRL